MPDEKTLRREGGRGEGHAGYGSRAHTVRLGGTGLVAGTRGRQLVTSSQEAGSRQEVGLGYKTSRSSLQLASTF